MRLFTSPASRYLRFIAGVGGLFFGLFAAPLVAAAHPLGNFTVNHLSRITAHAGLVHLHYVLDLAEIPTIALQAELNASGQPTLQQYRQWARSHARGLISGLHLEADGMPLNLTVDGSSVATRPGAAGLRTVYFTADYTSRLPWRTRSLSYADTTEPGRLGWKDVVLAPQTEPTHELRVYPSALVGSPRTRVTLAATIDAAGNARQTTSTNAGSGWTAPSVARMNALSELLTQRGSGSLFMLGLLIVAVGLGALHALEPGHGKTLLAVSLVGARATARQAMILASALTIAHTAGVIALGAIVLFATRWIVPEAVYPWITLASGVLVATLGARALAAEMRRRQPVRHLHAHRHDHAHPHAHDHDHGLGVIEDHDHALLDDEAHAHAHLLPGTAALSFRGAVIAASTGNLAPCPAALVVLLAAVSLHRIGLGLTLIVAFSLGLAATLTTIGLAVVRGARWLAERPQFALLTRWAPLVSAGVIATLGAMLVGEGFAAQGVPASVPTIATLTLLAIAGYAFTSPHRALHARTHTV